MDYKLVIAVVSVALTLIGYSFYFRSIFDGRTKPHAYSWLVWGFLTAIAFAGQISDNAGPGAWVTLVTGLVSFVIFAIAIKQGSNPPTTSDKLSLVGAIAAVGLWFFTSEPLSAIILITIADFLGFVPTIRKSHSKPQEELLIHYAFAGFKFVLAIIALDNYSLVTWLYPASLVAANWLFIPWNLLRRRKVASPF